MIQGKDVNLFQPAVEFLPMIHEVGKFSVYFTNTFCSPLLRFTVSFDEQDISFNTLLFDGVALTNLTLGTGFYFPR